MKTAHLLLSACLAASAPALGQVISTFAGGGTIDGLDAINAPLGDPRGLAVDASGNLYIADGSHNRVYRIDGATQKIYTAAGAGTGAGGTTTSGGPATQFALSAPYDVTLDSAGNLFIADASNFSLRRVDAATGVITTVGQQGQQGFPTAIGVDDNGSHVYWSGTAPFVRVVDVATGQESQFNSPSFVTATSMRQAGGFLYVTDTFGKRVWKYSVTTGVGTPIAGNGTEGFSGDGGPATSAMIKEPRGIAVDASGNVYFIDGGNGRVRRVDAVSGNIDTVAGGGTGDNGLALATRLDNPQGVAVSGSRVYISERFGRVRMVEAGTISTYAGGNGITPTSLVLASAGHPFTFDAAGNAYVVDVFRVRRIDAATGMVSIIAGNGSDTGPTADDGPATQATVTAAGIAVDALGNVFVSDYNRLTVRRIDASTGIITRYAGAATFSSTPDGDGGPATDAHLAGPRGLAFDPAGNLHISAGGRIRKVDKTTGIITTVLGAGNQLDPPDGTPASAVGIGVGGVPPLAFDAAGNLYYSVNKTYRVAAATGLVQSLGPAGNGFGLAVDNGGNVYFSDPLELKRIAAADGRVTVVAGTNVDGSVAGEGGSFATTANLRVLRELAIGPGGHLYLSDGPRIRKVTFEGISAWPGAVAFAGRLPNTTSLPISVTFTNLGPASAAISAISAPPPFGMTHNCGATLASGASCVADVTYTPTAVGSDTGTLDVTAAPAVVQDVPLTGASEISLVTHYYESILRRRSDPSGFAFWGGERTRVQGLGASVNETWFAMSSFFFRSAEYLAFNRSATDFTTDLYRTFFNRAPDASGQQFWIDQIAAGMPREVVLAEFQHSAEFATFTQGLFGNIAARAEVNLVMDFYRGLMGRLPDSSGFNTWVAQFRTAQCAADPAVAVATKATEISELFATSLEYAQRNRTNPQYVGDLYNAFLRRGGDLTGVLAWIAALDNSTSTRQQLRDAFRSSSEFQARIAAVVAQGCL